MSRLKNRLKFMAETYILFFRDYQCVKRGQGMKKTLSNMLQTIIEEEKVDKTILCKGLCSASAMSRYIYGESRPDRLLLNVLLQRLGKSPTKFATLLDKEEYAYFQWKQQISLAQLYRDWKQMECLLQDNKMIFFVACIFCWVTN